jgi:2-hydroxychromene-2-carboxylate isomerase
MDSGQLREMGHEMNLDFWFEFASTYSYPAAMRVEALAAERGIAVSWRAFLLGPIFNAQGWNDSPFNIYPVKGRYMWRDLERTCAAHEIPFRRPSQFPRNGLLAARVACRFSEARWVPAFVRAVYRANFAEDRDISAPETIARCLSDVGQDPAGLLEQAQSPEAKALLRARSEEAIRLGIFGAPSFLVGSELFWGHDRLADALSWAVEHAA